MSRAGDEASAQRFLPDRRLQARAAAAGTLAVCLSVVLWVLLLGRHLGWLNPQAGLQARMPFLVSTAVSLLSLLMFRVSRSVDRRVEDNSHERFLIAAERAALLAATDDSLQTAERASQLALVVEQTDNAVVVTDRYGLVQWVNPGFVRLSGYSLEEVVGRKPGSLLQGPETNPQTVAELRAAIADCRKIRTEIVNYAKDGRKYWIEIHLQPVFGREGDVEKFIAIETDISARKAAETALATTSSFLQEIVDNVPVALFVKSGHPATRGQFTLWNRTAEGLFGLTRDEALGKTDFDLFPAAQAETFGAVDRETFESAKPRLIPEEVVDSRLLGQRTLRTVKVPIFAADGSPAYLLGVSEDITDRKKIEADLLRAKEAAEAATQAKSAFLAAMSHEIRTPMNGILGLIDLMAEAPSRVERKQLLRTIRDSGHALLHIIDDVLTFSKAEANRLTLEQVDVDLFELLDSVMSTLAPLASRGKVMLLLEMDPAVPRHIGTDPVRLRQVLFNLLSNAIKFTPPSLRRLGEVTLKVRASPSDGTSATTLVMTVADNGIGMSEATLKELFQPFVQADVSTTRRFGGTGLGLSIVRAIAQLADGTISAASTPGEGSEFTLTWTAERSQQQQLLSQRPLLGVRVVMCGHARLESVVRGYLTGANCNVTEGELDVSDEPCAKADEQVIYVLRSSRLAGLSPEQTAQLLRRRFVVLEEPGERVTIEQGVRVSTQPLSRADLLSAVAVAAGLASPDTVSRFDDPSPATAIVPTLAEAEAEGRLILVAEDNAINREVVERQLARLGYACVVMPDGESALSAWKERRFGLLLTDCHMPGIDGFALTREIRKAESARGRMPILAVTANAVAGEAEHCISAGMDDYLTKPMTLEALRLALVKWLPPTGSPRGSLDRHALAAYVGDDVVLQHHLLRSFLPQARELLSKIAVGMAGELALARAEAHKLKASATVVGANRVAELCATIEAYGPNTEEPTADLSERLNLEMGRVEREITSILAEAKTTSRPAALDAGSR